MQSAGKKGTSTLACKDAGIFLGHIATVGAIAYAIFSSGTPVAFKAAAFLTLLAAVYGPTLIHNTDEDRKERIDWATVKFAKEPGFLMRHPKVNSAIAERATSAPIVIAGTLLLLAGIYGLGLMVH